MNEMKKWLGIVAIIGAFSTPMASAQLQPDKYRVYVRNWCDGECIVVHGGMNDGIATAVQKAIDENPHIKKIGLRSRGGWTNSGWWLYKTIKKNEMDTYAKVCLSACTIAFIAGKNRILKRRKGLGFHKVNVDGDVTSNSISNEGRWRSIYRKAGVKKWFLKKMFTAPPHDMWYPTRQELLDAGVITQ